MSISIRLRLLPLIPIVLAGCIEEEIPEKTEPAEGVKLTILYDNNPGDPNLRSAWGFSCLVQMKGMNLLFDTGGDWRTLEHNMRELRVDPRSIGIVLLSHAHGDHIGGLGGFLAVNTERRGVAAGIVPAQFQEIHIPGGSDSDGGRPRSRDKFSLVRN